MKPPKTVKTLLPPLITINKLTNKYDLYIDVRWGGYETQLKLTKEAAGLTERALEAVAKALLEASETTNPFL